MSVFRDLSRITRAYLSMKAGQLEARASMYGQTASTGSRSGATVEPRNNFLAQAIVEREDVNVATSVRVIVNAIAGLPIVIKRKEIGTDGSVNYVNANDHPGVDQLRKPNAFNTTKEMVRHNITSLLLTGNSFTAMPQAETFEGRRPLWLLPSWQVRVHKDVRGFPDRYDYTPDVKPIPFDLTEMVHCRIYNAVDPFYGASSIEPLRRQLMTDYMAELFNYAFFKNDATPRLVFVPEAGASAIQRMQAEQDIKDKNQGWDKKHGVTTLPGPGKLETVTPSFTDMEFSELRRFHRERVFGLLGITPFLGGVMEYANYANALIQEASSWRHSFLPLCDLWSDFLTRQWMWTQYDEDHIVALDSSGVEALQDDQLKKAQTAVYLSGGPVFTVDEIRTRWYNLEPIEGGDQLRAPAGATGFDSINNDSGSNGDQLDEDKINRIASDMAEEFGLSDDQTARIRDMLRSAKVDGMLLQAIGPAGAIARTMSKANGNGTHVVTREEMGRRIGLPRRKDLNHDDRQVYAWKSFDKRTARFEDHLATALAKFFRGQAKRVLQALDEKSFGGIFPSQLFLCTIATTPTVEFVREAVKDGGLVVATRVIRKQGPDDVNAILNLALENEFLIKELMPLIQKIVEASGELALADFNLGGSFNVENPRVYAMIDSFVNRLTNINDTTYDKLKALLKRAYQEGLSTDEIARMIREKFSQFSSVRAKTIARTEMTGMVNGAGLESWKQNGVTHKEWIATLDSRTRDAHVQYNGEIVPIDEPFGFGPEPIMYPGDPAASPGNVINCRCTVAPIFQEDMENE